MSEKKSGSSWEEAEQLGPYQLHESITDSANAQGELFRATNPSTGATALVLKLTAREGAAPSGDWQVRFMFSSVYHFLSMEVGCSPWSRFKDKQSAEELVFAFEDMRDAVKIIDQQLSPPSEEVPRRRPVLAWAGAAVACALILVGLHWVWSSPMHGLGMQERTVVAQAVPTEELPPPMGNSFIEAVDGGLVALAHPFPRQPYKGQKRPPCNPEVEVEIMGACWVPHERKAPCPKELYEYQGKCFTTSMLAPAPSNSLGQ